MFSSIRDQPQSQRPAAQPSHSSTRLNDCLGSIKQAFADVVNENTKLKSQLEDLEGRLVHQVNELKTIKDAMYDLEAHHARARQEYHSELHRLRNELQHARQKARDPRYPPGLGPANVAPGPPGGPPEVLDRNEQAPIPQGQSPDPDAGPEFASKDALAPPQRAPSQPVQAFPGGEQASRPSQGGSPQASGPGLSVPAAFSGTPKFNPKSQRILDVELTHKLSHESEVCCVRFSADGLFLATGCYRFARIYDVETGQMKYEFNAGGGEGPEASYVRCVSFSPDGKLLATSASNTTILIWDIKLKEKLTKLDGHAKPIYSLAFSSDGSRIVSGSADGTVRIWNWETRHYLTLTVEERAGIMSAAMSPDGRFVASGSVDAVIRVWDVASQTLIECLRGHSLAVVSVAFTPDGKGLFSGSLDRRMKLWDITAIYGTDA